MGAGSGTLGTVATIAAIAGGAALIAGTGGAAAVPLGAGLGAGAGGTAFGTAAAGGIGGGLGMAALPLALTAASGGLAAYGQIQEGNQASDMYKYQAQVAKNNAELAKDAAKDAEIRGENAAQQTRLRTRQVIGNYRASAAARGVEVDSGSALDTTVDLAGIGELDALLIKDNATREAWGYNNQAIQFQDNAKLDKKASVNVKRAAGTAAFGTLLGTGSSVAARWYQRQ